MYLLKRTACLEETENSNKNYRKKQALSLKLMPQYLQNVAVKETEHY